MSGDGSNDSKIGVRETKPVLDSISVGLGATPTAPVALQATGPSTLAPIRQRIDLNLWSETVDYAQQTVISPQWVDTADRVAVL